MQIFELNFSDGFIKKLIVANDAEEAKKIGEDPYKHPDLCFRPFQVIPIEVEGFEIILKPIEEALDEQNNVQDNQLPQVPAQNNQESPFDSMTKSELKEWLDERNIEYVPQWGEKRLRELVEQHSAE